MTEQNSSHAIEPYWQAYHATLSPAEQRRWTQAPEAWGFGDSPAMADELGALVLAGIKTATCSLLWEYEVTGERVPQVGDLSIILDGKGQPLCIIQTSEITVKPYSQVDAAFAFEEGEDDRSLRSWRKAHWDFFSRSCRQIGRTVHEEMPLICERFRVVWRGSENHNGSGEDHGENRL